MSKPYNETQSVILPVESSPLAQPVSAEPLVVIEAEWVRRYPSRRRGQGLRWITFAFKIGVACALTYLFYMIPPSAFPDPFQNWKNPVIIFLLICFIGKTMLDTFFYDHYQP